MVTSQTIVTTVKKYIKNRDMAYKAISALQGVNDVEYAKLQRNMDIMNGQVDRMMMTLDRISRDHATFADIAKKHLSN